VCWLATAGIVPLNIMMMSLPNVDNCSVLPGTEAFAQPHQHQQRTYPPGDPEHGQECAQLVGRDGAEDLAENVGKTLHSALGTQNRALNGMIRGGFLFRSRRNNRRDGTERRRIA